MNVGLQVNSNFFEAVDDRRVLIGLEMDNIQEDTSKVKCDEVKMSISNTREIIVKLGDLRNAQTHNVQEFAKGMFNVIGGVAALTVLALVQLVCLPTLVIPGICKAKTGSIFLPGFSEMSTLVSRGWTEMRDSCSDDKVLYDKVSVILEDLNLELQTLPEKRQTMNAIKQSVHEVKSQINEINQLQTEYGFKVIENMPTIIAGRFFFSKDKIDSPYFDSLNALDADNFPFVMLVNELSTIANSHVADLKKNVQDSLSNKLVEDSDDDEFSSGFEIHVDI